MKSIIKKLVKWGEQKYIYYSVLHKYKKLQGTSKPAIPYDAGEKLVILGNGPSQKLFWENRERFKNYKILCMNEFPVFEKDKFILARPDYYCAIDPVAVSVERAKQVKNYDKIMEEKISIFNNEISWDMGYVTWSESDDIYDNHYIRKIGIPRITCDKLNNDDKIQLFSQNMATVNAENVAEIAVFFGITFGFREIAIFGVDLNFSISVNEKMGAYFLNCYSYNNHLEAGSVRQDGMHHWVYEAYESLAVMHREFVVLRYYSEKKGVKIYNFSAESMLDAFEKAII